MATGPGSERAPAAAPGRLPVLRHLDRAIALAAATPLAGLAAAVGAWARGAPWTRNEGYVQAPPDDRFLDGYGYAALALLPGTAGADGRPRTGLCAGVLLLAPGMRYPAHHHPAEEVYLPLTLAWWSRDGGPLRPVPAGQPVLHRPWQPHAMVTRQDPLLALYLWTGDVSTPATFC